MMGEWWLNLPANAQDALILGLLLALPLALGLIITRGFNLGALLKGLIRRHIWTCAIFTLLVALSVGTGVAVLALERGLRQASARVADRFDLVIAAPGDEIGMLMATVFLQPTDVPLLDGHTFEHIATSPRVKLAAPLAFGDSWQGAPIIGSTAAFVTHLGGDLAAGRMFASSREAIAGARVPLAIGARFSPAHGHGEGAEHDAHAGVEITITGRMAPTGSPWDRALIVPVESVWETHGMGDGHALQDIAAYSGHTGGRSSHDHEDDHGADLATGDHAQETHDHEADQDARMAVDWASPDHSPDAGVVDEQGRAVLGPPFDPRLFPGVPAIVVATDDLAAAYGLQAKFNDGKTMAFFPGAVLSRLHLLMGNFRAVLSVFSTVTQLLVAAAVLAGLGIFVRLFARRLALLRALGAPARMVFALVWSFAVALLATGGVLALAVGWGVVRLFASVLSAQTDLLLTPNLGWSEFHLVALFLGLAGFVALVPAAIALMRPVTEDLRNG